MGVEQMEWRDDAMGSPQQFRRKLRGAHAETGIDLSPEHLPGKVPGNCAGTHHSDGQVGVLSSENDQGIRHDPLEGQGRLSHY
jgi:hypothetical protein